MLNQEQLYLVENFKHAFDIDRYIPNSPGMMKADLALKLRILHSNHASGNSRFCLPTVAAKLARTGKGVYRRCSCLAGKYSDSEASRPSFLIHSR